VEEETSKAITSNSRSSSFEELAMSQGILPVVEFDALCGHPSAEDESLDEFEAMLREWGCEGSAPTHS